MSKKDKKTKEDVLDRLGKKHPRLSFWLRVGGFYGMMLLLYLYFMTANLSTAPKYVYTQF